MEFNLHTTIKAYPKVSKSILKDYVTKEDLDMELDKLDKYVEEAPMDKYTYARNMGEWVPITDEVLLKDKELYYGLSDMERLCTKQDLLDLGEYKLVPKDVEKYNLSYDMKRIGFLWICCNYPIRDIRWKEGFVADYIPQIIEVSTREHGTYYCYRIREPLIPGVQEFKIVF